MNKDLIDFYNEEYRKVEKEIQELNEVNKKSPKRIARLVEIEYILDGLNANQFAYYRKEISDSTVLALEYAFMIEDTTNGSIGFRSDKLVDGWNGWEYVFTDGKHYFYKIKEKE